jgi:hypothetical protein
MRRLLLLFCAPLLAVDLHSHYGESFDTGPREKPWVMEGIGVAHFPITTKNPEVQKWFDQGNELLHSFWYFEAERSFRWCLKLEPDNAMAYWGLARAADEGKRSQDMIREAVKRKGQVTERERLYIDALAADLLPDPLTDKPERSHGRKLLETLCVKYPDDMEARALLALGTMGSDRYGARYWRSSRIIRGRTIIASTTGTTTSRSRRSKAPGDMARSCRGSDMRCTCRGIFSASWGCGTRRRFRWTRRRGAKNSTCRKP